MTRPEGLLPWLIPGNSVEYSIGVLQHAIRFIENEIVGQAELVDIQTDELCIGIGGWFWSCSIKPKMQI